MKRFAIAAAALLWCTPAMAHHKTRITTSDNVEIEPSHCVLDGIFGTWNCWYTPVPKRRAWPPYRDHQHHYDHHHRSTWQTPYFRPNEHNEHGTPCYFYKKNGWCF